MALINCPECGKKISDKSESCINCGCPISLLKSRPESIFYDSCFDNRKTVLWKSGRIFIGIISILLSIALFNDISAQTFVDLLNGIETDIVDAGGCVAVFLFLGGLAGLCTCNSESHYALSFVGILFCASYIFRGDEIVWAIISQIFGLVYIICAIKTKKIKQTE